MRIDEIISVGEELQEALGGEPYLTLAGHKSEPDFHEIIRCHSQLTPMTRLRQSVQAGHSPSWSDWWA